MSKSKILFNYFFTLIEKHFLIQKIYYQKKYFGPAHLRALNLIERNPGISLTDLIFKLKVTKQSLNRVLRDLLKNKMIKQIKNREDTRKKNLFLDREGKQFFETVYNAQKKRIFNALRNSEPESVIKFKEVLKKIIDGK